MRETYTGGYGWCSTRSAVRALPARLATGEWSMANAAPSHPCQFPAPYPGGPECSRPYRANSIDSISEASIKTPFVRSTDFHLWEPGGSSRYRVLRKSCLGSGESPTHEPDSKAPTISCPVFVRIRTYVRLLKKGAHIESHTVGPPKRPILSISAIACSRLDHVPACSSRIASTRV
jgi:hypothetical protein